MSEPLVQSNRHYQSRPDRLYRTLGGRAFLLPQGVLTSKAGEPFYAPNARKAAPYWPHHSLSEPEVTAGHALLHAHRHDGNVHPISDGHSPLYDHHRRPPAHYQARTGQVAVEQAMGAHGAHFADEAWRWGTAFVANLRAVLHGAAGEYHERLRR